MPVVVELTGVTFPAAFPCLPEALAALWRAMQVLPLGDLQHDWFGYYLTRENAADHVARALARDGDLALSFVLPGSSQQHLLRVWCAPSVEP
ncbi:hypothetical protein [Kitasatospora viridis]|uniref:hypothetical protein n=1 Tax=Kitasatospora viridis TaxID=281105 RepID=UPI0011AA3B8F|nr:hypothetical protein [Kitasatospora viridis]